MRRKMENGRQPWKNEGREGRVARRADATDSLIISIAYANLRGETGLDAIRGNYFTLAKWLLLVVEPRVVSRSSAHTVHKVRTEREGDESEAEKRRSEKYRTEWGEAYAWIVWCVPGRAWLPLHIGCLVIRDRCR